MPQVVLEVVADPSHPQLAAKLRIVAATAHRQNRPDFQAWMNAGVFSRLLGVLRALPTLGLDNFAAAHLCAAAAAAIGNIIQAAQALEGSKPALPACMTAAMLRKEASCDDVLGSVVRYGLLNPAAAQQLPPGCEVHVDGSRGSVPADVFSQTSCASQASREFWTPWRICCYTVSDRVVVGDNVNSAIMEALAPAVTSTTFEKLFNSVVTHPCGEAAATHLNGPSMLRTSRSQDSHGCMLLYAHASVW